MDTLLNLFLFATVLNVLPSHGAPQMKLLFPHYKNSLEAMEESNKTVTLAPPTTCDVSSCIDKEGEFPLTDTTFVNFERFFIHCTGDIMQSVCKQCPGDSFFNPNCRMCMEEEMKNTTDCPNQMNVTEAITPEPLPVCSDTCQEECRNNGPSFNGTRADPMDRSRFAACYMGGYVACMWCPKAFDMNRNLARLQHNDTMQACLFEGDRIYQDQNVN